MTDVIYRIPTWLLGVLIVGLSAGLSMLGLVVVHRLVPLEKRRPHNDVAGYLSNIAAFVYAVLLAFIAVAVWQDYGNAQSTAQLEANAASDVFRQAQGYPEPFRRRVREGIRAYVEATMQQWSRESTGQFGDTASRDLELLHRDLLQFEPHSLREELVHRQQLHDMSRLLDQRRNRIFAAGSGLNPVIWSIILSGSVLIVAFAYFMGTGSLRAHLAMTAILGASIGLVIFLIVAMDYPFRGDIGIKPSALDAVLKGMHRGI
jgi:hypothetical protein